MEEKKNTKTVDINKGSNVTEQKKLTYEQLTDVCNQLWQQVQQLRAKNKELERMAMNKRIDCLFKVLELSNMFSSDFVVSCSSEIEEALTVPQSQENKNNKGE